MRDAYDRLADNISSIDSFLTRLRAYRDLSGCEHPKVIKEAETDLLIDYTEQIVEIDDLKMQIERLKAENKSLRKRTVEKAFFNLGWDFLEDEDDDE